MGTIHEAEWKRLRNIHQPIPWYYTGIGGNVGGWTPFAKNGGSSVVVPRKTYF